MKLPVLERFEGTEASVFSYFFVLFSTFSGGDNSRSDKLLMNGDSELVTIHMEPLSHYDDTDPKLKKLYYPSKDIQPISVIGERLRNEEK